MNEFIQNMTGMGAMTEQVIATDFLITAKTGVKNIATAITETSSPDVRETLKQYLNDAIETHEQITNYMISKGYYNPSNLPKQIQIDTQAAEVAKDLPQM
ncbi:MULTISPECIES: spore coat protein [Bacillus]|uniref:spore coat protein n=1 Tax=Bacillus TaxID=1386 RepID=UPI000422EDBB|nr:MULTISPECIES: spore coat protein [Bacillus]QHZ46924.1 spore coat protein [Bacillus sp. NSP9.1]WFA07056.1 spore coat protein [Bacillus sp. HSf4]